jgi:putative multiple sugar transport system substrate-binding protein
MIIMKNRILWLLIAIILSGVLTSWLTSCSDNDDNNNDNQKRVAVLLPDGASLARWTTAKASLAFRQSTLRLPL